MESYAINYLAVLVAALAYMALGALWYSPILFGNAWMKGLGKTKEQIAAEFTPLNYLWAVVMSFIASYGIARIMKWSGMYSVGDGIMVGLLAGVCFVLTALGVNDIFENRPKGLTVVNILYHVVGLVLVGIIIGAW